MIQTNARYERSGRVLVILVTTDVAYFASSFYICIFTGRGLVQNYGIMNVMGIGKVLTVNLLIQVLASFRTRRVRAVLLKQN